MSTTSYLLIGGIVVIVLLIVVYNRLVALRQGYKNAYADIEAQRKQRHDLVPDLREKAAASQAPVVSFGS
jgi:LemA protein